MPDHHIALHFPIVSQIRYRLLILSVQITNSTKHSIRQICEIFINKSFEKHSRKLRLTLIDAFIALRKTTASYCNKQTIQLSKRGKHVMIHSSRFSLPHYVLER